MRRQFLLLQRRFALHRRCSFSFFGLQKFYFLSSLGLGLGAWPPPCVALAPRVAAASSLQVVHFQCSCRRHRVVVLWMPWLGAILPRPPDVSRRVSVRRRHRVPLCEPASNRRLGPIAVFLVVQTSSLSACCVATRSLVLHLPCPLSFSVSPQTRLFVLRPPAVASGCSWRSGRRLLAPWEVWVGAARRGTFCY